MFKSNKPAGQPRTLRSIAESKNERFEEPTPEDRAVYRDNAQTAPTASPPPAQKQPFGNVRGGH
jgi:hypothetical protein